MLRLPPVRCALGCALLLTIAPCAAAQDLAAFEKRVTVKTLDNGLTLIVCERPEAPVFSFFFVGPQLTGARYLYLAACGWALLMGDLLWSVARRLPRPAAAFACVVAAIAVVSVAAIQRELEVWQRAASLRDLATGKSRRLTNKGSWSESSEWALYSTFSRDEI